MQKRRLMLTALVLALAMALVAGCGGGKKSATPVAGPAKSPSGTAAEAPATPSATAGQTATTPTPATATITTVPVASTELRAVKNLPLFLDDFWTQQNLKMEYREYQGGSNVSKALLNGEVDFAFSAITNVLKDKSGEMRIVALITRGPGHAVLVDSRHAAQIKSLADLKGQKVGVSDIGAGPHQTLNLALGNAGVDPSTLTILPVGLKATEIFAESKVAATVTLEPHITEAVENGSAVVLLDTRTPEGIAAVYGDPDVPWIALVTRQDVIAKNPDLVRRVVGAVVTAQNFITSAGTDDIMGKVTSAEFIGDNTKLFRGVVGANRKSFAEGGRVSRRGVELIWSSLQESGAVPQGEPVPWEQVVALEFLDSALASR